MLKIRQADTNDDGYPGSDKNPVPDAPLLLIHICAGCVADGRVTGFRGAIPGGADRFPDFLPATLPGRPPGAFI